jgi:membrane protein YdbS with pleckstrin-like domain
MRLQAARHRYANDVVFTIKRKRPKSVAGRAWNLAQDAVGIAALVLIGLKLAGLASWSWWWVLAPLWLSGALLAVTLLPLLVLLLLLRQERWSNVTRPQLTEPPPGPGR